MKKYFYTFLFLVFIIVNLASLPPSCQAFSIIDSDGLKLEGRLASDFQESQWVLILRQFGVFLIFVAFILLVVLIITIYNLFCYLASDRFFDKLKLVFKIFFQDPAKFFTSNAPRDLDGTYQLSFWEGKKLHSFGKKNLIRFLGLIFIIFLIFILIALGLNHTINAETANYLK